MLTILICVLTAKYILYVYKHNTYSVRVVAQKNRAYNVLYIHTFVCENVFAVCVHTAYTAYIDEIRFAAPCKVRVANIRTESVM